MSDDARPLRGRTAELRDLDDALSAAAAGRSETALILGDHGYGKTRLVDEMRRLARERGFLVDPPGARDTGSGRIRFDRPVLTVLDDTLLNAEPVEFARMTALLEAHRDEPRLSLITLRKGAYGLDGHRFVSALEERRSTRVELGALDADAVKDILTDVLGTPPDPDLVELADTAAGNPLYVVSLAQGLVEDGQVEIGQGAAARRSDAVPERLRTMATCQLNELAPEAQHLVRAAAALGPVCGVDSLIAVFTGPAARLVASIQQIVDAGIMERHGDELVFRYELMRWAFAETTPPAVRQKMVEEVTSVLLGGLGRRPALRPPASPAPTGLSARPGAPEPAAERSADLPRRIFARLVEGRLDEVHELAISLLGTCRPFGDTPARIQALMALSVCARLGGQPSAALRRSREAAALTLGMRERDAFLDLAPLTALELTWLGESTIARWLLEWADTHEAFRTDPLRHSVAGFTEAKLLLRDGELQRADQVAEAVIDRAIGSRHDVVMPLCWAIRALVALRAGQLHTAERMVARYRGSERSSLGACSALPAWVAVQTAVERGGPTYGIDLLLGRYDYLVDSPALFVEEPGAAAWIVRIAQAVGASEVANEAVAAVRRLADTNPDFAPVVTAATHAEGLHRQDPHLLTEALYAHSDPWGTAWAAEDLAGLPERGDALDRLPVVLNLARAHLGFEQAGDTARAARAGRLLSGLTTAQVPHPLPRPVVGRQPLSGSERAVVELVVQGLTNRQAAERLDLSPNTVNFHLRNVFRKFGISSRVELARLYQSPRASGTPSGT